MVTLTKSYNQRELNRKAKLVISMKGQSTYITDPSTAGGEVEPKSFTFDYSYWSHDNFVEQPDGYLAPASPEYADQVN